MAHAIWTGSINFGLVTIPVRLISAVHEEELHFHFLHDADEGRIQNVRRCAACHKEVSWDHVVRAYEVEKAKMVVVTDEDFKKVNPAATQSIDIVEFVDATEIDPMLYDRPYYLEPEKKGRHAYALLRDALADAGKVGVAKIVLRSREHVAMLKPHGRALVVVMMHYAAEIAPEGSLDLPPAKEKMPPAEMKMARMLIDTMAAKFDPTAFDDTYRDELLELIEARAKNKPLPKAKAAPPKSNVVDLMSVLQKSLEATKKKGAAKAPKRAAKKRKAS